MSIKNSEKMNIDDKMDLLSNDSQKIINDFLNLYKDNITVYKSAVTDLLIKDAEKDEARQLNYNDYFQIKQKYQNTQIKTPDAFKVTFFRYLYAYDLLYNNKGFEQEFHKAHSRSYFEKRRLKEKPKQEEKENARLSIEQILKIENFLESLDDEIIEHLKLSFVWYMIFDKGCSIKELKTITSDNFDGKFTISSPEKSYSILPKHIKLMEKLNSQQNKGFNPEDVVKRLGNHVGIDNLIPNDIKIARKQNMQKCSNCRLQYTNLLDNWTCIENRIVCKDCASKILKKNNKFNTVSIKRMALEDKYFENNPFEFDEWSSIQDEQLKEKEKQKDEIGMKNEEKVKTYLEKNDYKVKKVADYEGFDFHAKKNSENILIEVKTLNSKNEFIITINEIKTLMNEIFKPYYQIYLVKDNSIHIITDLISLILNSDFETKYLTGATVKNNITLKYERITISLNTETISTLPVIILHGN